jgi:hypothetical protein
LIDGEGTVCLLRPALMAVQGLVGGIQVQPDRGPRRGAGTRQTVRHQPIDSAGCGDDRLVA